MTVECAIAITVDQIIWMTLFGSDLYHVESAGDTVFLDALVATFGDGDRWRFLAGRYLV